MVWTPPNQVFDSSKAIENTFGFIQTYQSDALTWAANGGTVPADLAVFYNSIRNVSVFPALTVLGTSELEEWEDINDSVFILNLVCDIQSGDEDAAAATARTYALALKSMLANMAETTLFQNSIIPISATVKRIQVEYDFLAKQNHKFIQSFQIQAEWSCNLSAR